MGVPEWLTIPVAESDPVSRAPGRQRPGCLCFSADPIQAECRRAYAAHVLDRFDLDAWRRAERCGFIDCVDAGGLPPFVPDIDGPLDRHRLDVALSRGRHAAERAKLAGCRTLIGLGITAGDRVDGEYRLESCRYSRFARCTRPAAEPAEAAYAGLRRIARFEIAALTGSLIAGAQMGIQFHPRGHPASVAARIALDLNPAVRDWLIFSSRANYGFSTPLSANERKCREIKSNDYNLTAVTQYD